jgi:hypothetical protein
MPVDLRRQDVTLTSHGLNERCSVDMAVELSSEPADKRIDVAVFRGVAAAVHNHIGDCVSRMDASRPLDQSREEIELQRR